MGKWGKVIVMYIWLFCMMLFGSICCKDMRNVVVVEDGLKTGGEEVADLVSSYSSFECEIGNNIELKSTVSGIKDRMRYGNEGEVMVNTYGSGERSKFGESSLGMALGTILVSEVGFSRDSTDVF